jgi:hypothetical protein
MKIASEMDQFPNIPFDNTIQNPTQNGIQILTKLHTNFAYKFSIPIVQGWEDDFWENTALGHVVMMPQDRDSLFEPPLPRLQKTSVIFESPLKYIRKCKEQDPFFTGSADEAVQNLRIR